MARRRTRGRRRTGGGGLGQAAWLLALVLILGGAAAGAWALRGVLAGRGEADAATLCPPGDPPALLAVLLDLTDPLSPAQESRLRAILAGEVERAPEGAMVSLGVVSEDPDAWGAAFARCKPPSGEGSSGLTENPALLAERFAEGFEAPLDAALAQAMAGGAQDSSPIIEALQALLAATPGAEGHSDRLTLVIVSDLLQHSDTLSLYRGEEWEAFETSGAAQRLARNLDGTEVHLIRLPRPEAGAALALADPFWARYLDRQGAAAPLREVVLGDL